MSWLKCGQLSISRSWPWHSKPPGPVAGAIVPESWAITIVPTVPTQHVLRELLKDIYIYILYIPKKRRQKESVEVQFSQNYLLFLPKHFVPHGVGPAFPMEITEPEQLVPSRGHRDLLPSEGGTSKSWETSNHYFWSAVCQWFLVTVFDHIPENHLIYLKFYLEHEDFQNTSDFCPNLSSRWEKLGSPMPRRSPRIPKHRSGWALQKSCATVCGRMRQDFVVFSHVQTVPNSSAPGLS